MEPDAERDLTEDVLRSAWKLLDAAWDGNWSRAPVEWRADAVEWRVRYLRLLDATRQKATARDLEPVATIPLVSSRRTDSMYHDPEVPEE